jgi:tetratricopeptide (TPR) repeat protein
MWYLVVPPIVVVLSVSFLLWYLSRKGEDPKVALRVLENEERGAVAFPRTKEFFLRLLEKVGQHFKVLSLRIHNTFSQFTQSVRASRVRVHSTLEPEVSEAKEEIVESSAPVRPMSSSGDSILSTPIVRERAPLVETERKEEVPRPMVSEVAVHPEKRKRLVRPNVAREEDLIGRIARDPKDFTSYEALGDYYLEMDNIKDAKECYRQVLKLSPVHRMVKIKIRRLEKLLTKAGE